MKKNAPKDVFVEYSFTAKPERKEYLMSSPKEFIGVFALYIAHAAFRKISLFKDRTFVDPSVIPAIVL